MAINENEEGHNVFDPSKRIRAALGPEFTSNLQAEAANRLAAAMASTGVIRSPGELTLNEEENNMNFKGMIGKITHTNPRDPNNAEQDVVYANERAAQSMIEPNPMEKLQPEERAKVRGQALINSEKIVNDMFEKKPLIEKLVRSTTGFGIHDTAADNATHAIAVGVRNIAAAATTDAVETTFRMKDLKKSAIATGVSSAIDLAVTTWASGNGSRINKIFDPDVITSTEAANISKTIAKEKLKYGAQHALAAIIAPAILKGGIDKVFSSKIEKNNTAKVLTSFGALSEAGKLTLSIVRKISEKKNAKKAAENSISVSDSLNTPVEAYNDVAKLAINRIINETMDDTILGTVAGSLIGYRSVEYIETPNQDVETANKINEYLASVEQKKSDESAKTTAKPSSTKKSA